MKKNEKHKFNHKSKINSKDKVKNRKNSKIVKEYPIKDKTSNRPTILLNNELSIVQNQNKKILNIQNPALVDQSTIRQFQSPEIISQMQPQTMVIPQPNSQPVIIANSGDNPSISNDNIPQNDSEIIFKVIPQEILCPHCKCIISTNTEEKCNFFSCIFYFIILIFPVFFVFYELCIDIEDCYCEFECRPSNDGCCCFPYCCRCPNRPTFKDCLCCCDVEHYCSHCGKLIGTRNACIEICPRCCRCC